MGKVTGFKDYQLQKEEYLDPAERVKNYKEFVVPLTDEKASIQGARCMDCGIPFCNNTCPVNNVIPDWNDLVYKGKLRQAYDVLRTTNNFPELTGRVCPAPCEFACTLGLVGDPVGIKSIELYIIEKAWENGWVVPEPCETRTGKKVAVVGSGPAGMAAAQQLARVGHDVTVFEKNERIGGLMRYGVPDFKLQKSVIDRRIAQMEAEGVVFRTNVLVGKDFPDDVMNDAQEVISPEQLDKEFDAVILAGGAEKPRPLSVPGRELEGVHYAMDFLNMQNKIVGGDKPNHDISAKDKHVIVIGGGDTGSDCVGTAVRHGAASVTSMIRMARPPETEDKLLVWPYWPHTLQTSTSHEEGGERVWSLAPKRIEGKDGKVEKMIVVGVERRDNRYYEIEDSEKEIPADLILLATGFVSAVDPVLEAFGVEGDLSGNVKAETEGEDAYKTSVDKIFAAGDIRRGPSLLVWAIREGRQCARAVDEFLMGSTNLPR